VTELNIIGALLDQRNLTVVQDFLIAQDTTAFHLLSQAMDTYTGVQQLQANNNLSRMNEAASTTDTSEFAQSPVTWKKANKTCCRNMYILHTKVEIIDVCRLHLFWLGGNHKIISSPGCHCSPKQWRRAGDHTIYRLTICSNVRAIRSCIIDN